MSNSKDKQTTCTKCKILKKASDFYLDKSKKDGRSSLCRTCVKNNVRKYVKKNHDEVKRKKREASKLHYELNKETIQKRHKEWKKRNPGHALKYKLKKRYRMSIDDYNLKLKNQNNKCFICKTEKCKTFKRLSVDHCHITGKVRGLLCNSCNSGIGYFRDNIENLKRATEYLKIFKEKKEVITWVDPPQGWAFHFPKALPNPRPSDMRKWFIENGYPKKDVELALLHSRYWEEEV